MGWKDAVKQAAEGLFERSYNRQIAECTLSYEEWVDAMAAQSRMESRKEEKEKLVLLASEEGSWTSDAGERLSAFFEMHPEVLLAYTDEDVLGEQGTVWLKPDWSPDSFLYRDYLGGAVAVRAVLWEKLSEEDRRDRRHCRERLLELADGFTRGGAAIGHLPEICFHRNRHWELPGEAVPRERETERAEQLVSIVIPSKDNAELLLRCLNTLGRTILHTAYEVIVVDNGSCQHARTAVEKGLSDLNEEAKKRGCLRKATYLYEPMEFNFSKMCNRGAAEAAGGMLLFLNDDVEAVAPGWLELLVQKGTCPWVGAVGIKLYYPGSERIQHIGITNVDAGPAHKLRGCGDSQCYYDGRNRGIWNVLAVTGACLLVRREVFLQAGGFPEELRVAFNDVDFCFTLYELGYYNVVVNTVHLLHHESFSRGGDATEEKSRRLAGEYALLFARHPQLQGCDPFYHPWLSGGRPNLGMIVPTCKVGRVLPDRRHFAVLPQLKNARRESCVLVCLEEADAGLLRGYAVVLGSNNACYRRELLLRRKDGCLFRIPFRGQYRYDLTVNLPDQKNVAMCGFQVELAKPLPPGEYRVGVLVRNRLTGAGLYHFAEEPLFIGGSRQ